MTRIKKLPHKRLSFPPQEIQNLREKLETTSSANIHGVLQSFSDWPFVRGDMYHWIGVLNRFDDILANVCEEHGLSGFQTKAFDRDTQRMVVVILDFTRLLLENCINRNLYSSVERLDQLLNASDPEILEHTVRVVLRTAQRWSYQRDVKANLATFSARLTAISDPWNVKKHLPAAASAASDGDNSEAGALVLHTNEFRMLASDEHTELLKKHADVVDYQFFRTAEEARLLEEDSGAAAPPATPSASHAQRKAQSSKRSAVAAATVSEGLVSINARIWDVCDAAAVGGLHEQMQQAFDRLVLLHRVPAAHHYELRHRIYVALALGRGDQALRLRLLRARIYAAGVLSLMMGEQEFKNAFLSREPSYTADVIGVLQPEAHAPLSVQTAVFLVLEGLLKLRSELSGAYVALNASANHGVLMFVLRKAFAAGSNDADPPAYPYEFTSALMSFLTAMVNSMNGGQLLVSAGVVPIFVAALRNSHPGHLRSAGRVAKLLDLLISSATPAFPAFCSANGITTLVKRIHSEVISAVAVSDANPEAAADLSSPVALPRFPDGARQAYRRREILSAEQIYLLKELFKFMSHLVQQTGYQDRLRNLVETTLPETLRTIVTHPAAFGANVYGLAISISATLVHNEPTSLPIMQEARLPQVMLEALEAHIPYNGDVIVHIPAALGAFCLNDAGLEQVRQSTVIRKALSTFSDPDFVRVLQEGDVPGLFGSVLDEFMRHFPTVKDAVMDETIEMLRRVILMGAADSPLRQLDPGNTYLLRAPLPPHVVGAEVATDDKGAVPLPHHDDYYGMMMESATTFLEGLLEQRTHSALFMDKGGWDVVVQAVRSPLLPFEFAKTRTFKSMHGLSTLLLETSQERVFAALFRELKLCLEQPLAFSPVDGQSIGDMVGAYVALASPSGLTQDAYDAVHSRLHNTVAATGIISLITTLINGSGGGSLARSIKELTDVVTMDDFIGVLRSITDTYKAGIQAAVAVEAEMARIQPPSKAGDALAEDRKGKGREMDVDGGPATISVEPYVRTNLQNLSETAVSFTMEAGEYIECMSNSLGLTIKAKDEAGTVTKVGPALATGLVDFVLGMLALCRDAGRTEAGAQLVDQAMVILMKTLVFARHRIYLKLRILVPFVEGGGLKLFCEVLESMWSWAECLPAAPAPATSAVADPNAKLRKVLENVLESMLSILSFVLDGEPVAECPEFLAMCQEHEAERAWFRPGDFVSELRLQAMGTLQLVWMSPLLVNGGNGQIMGSFIGCLGPVLSGNHEATSSKQAASATATRTGNTRTITGSSIRERLDRHYEELLDRRRAMLGGAAGGPTLVPSLRSRLFAPASGAEGALSPPTWSSVRGSPLGADVAATSAPPVVPNSAHVDELIALGFTMEQAEAALIRNLNSLARAANDLLSGAPEAPAPAAAPAAAPAPAPAPAAEAEASQEAEPASSAPTETQDTEPMAVDTATTAEPSAASGSGDESSVQQGSDANAAASEQPSGIEPFNQPAWREAKEHEEDSHRIDFGLQRVALRASIAPQAIVLIDEIGEKAVIPIKGILELVVRKGEPGPVVDLLLGALVGLLEAAAVLGVGDNDEARIEERLYAHAYLWAVLLSSVAQMDEMYPLAGPLRAPLIRALDVAAASRLQAGRAPKWLTTVLLVAELLLQRDAEPPKAKLDPKEEWHRAARRGLTKLPPSAAPVDESVAAPTPITSEAERVSQLFAAAMGAPESSAFEPIPSHDEGEDSEDDDDEDVAAAGGDDVGGEGSQSKPPPAGEPVFGADDKLELQRMATAFFSGPNVAQYSPAELNALLRLIVILTRCPKYAVEFLDSGSLASVVRALRSVAPGDMPSISAPGAGAKEKAALGFVNALMTIPKEQQRELRQERTLVMHVLRHVVESKPVLKLQLENLIHDWYRSPQFSASDIHSYVNSTLVYALRDPELFTQVSVDRNYLPSFNDEMRIHWMVLAWRSRPLLDEEEVDRFEAAPKEEPSDATASAAAGEGAAEATDKPEEAKDGESFMEYLAKKEKKPAFEPYELDAESERLACRVAEFVAEEILALRPAAPPAVARAATTTSGTASSDAQQQPPPATPVSKLRASASYTGLATPTSSSAAACVPDDSPDTIAYRCYLMQGLSELVSSFPFVLQALFVARTVAPVGLLSPRKANKGKVPASTTSEEPQLLRIRSPLISHLVHDLIVREAVINVNAPKHPGKGEDAAAAAATAAAAAAGDGELEQVLAIARHQIAIKRGQLSQHVTFWATALLSTLCVRHQEGWTTTAGDGAAFAGSKVDGDKEVTLDSLVGSYGTALYAARHLTLDHIVRAFRECLAAASASPLHGNDVTYARLTSLARLTYRLVTARPINPGRMLTAAGAEQQEKENPNTLKKMLLERGILDLLTAASSRLNLNHPQGREMLNLFLRPMEHLAKAAVKISRESVLQAWEESGQEKMPTSAVSSGSRGGGFNMDLLEDENALVAEDEDIPPDLYENSALGLHQNQRTGHDAGDMFNEDDLMEEDFEEELYDDDNSSVSDIDTDDEDMDENMLLDESIVDEAEAGDGMDMDGSVGGIGRGRGDDDDDDDDDLSGSESGSMSGDDDGDDEDDDLDEDDDGEGLDTDIEIDLDLGGHHGQSAAEFLAFEEDRMMAADEREADFYGSDLDGEVVPSDDGRLEGEDGAEQDGGWESELSDADLGMLEAIHHTLTHHAHRHHHHHQGHLHSRIVGRGSRPGSGDGNAGVAAIAATAAAMAAGGEGADDDDDNDDDEGSGATSEDESHSESGDDPDMFPIGFPDSLEITMEAIDGAGNGGGRTTAAMERASGLSALLMETMAAGIALGRGGGGASHRLNGLPSLGRLGSLNGLSGVSVGRATDHGNPLLVRRHGADDMSGFYMPRMPGLGGGLSRLGGVHGGPSMLHPLVDRSERPERGGDRSASGLQQARAERVARTSLSGPLRTTPDDVFGLGQSLATQLSQALSGGRRPAYTHHLIPGASSQREPRAWLEESGSQPEPSAGVEYASSSSSSAAAHEVLEQLVRMCRAASAIENFMPLATAERWQEEARMQPRAPASAYTTRIGAPILNRLAPEAIRQNLLRQRYQVERVRWTAEVDRRRIEREAAERREREAEAEAERARVEAEAERVRAEQGEDMALDAEEKASEASSGGEEAPAAAAEEEAAAEPVYVVIDGERIDITDTGIDPEFLLALPDDLRLEVIEGRREQQRVEQRQNAGASSASGADAQAGAAAAAAGVTDGGISQEFLDALPPEIREEVLEQERLQRQLLDRDEMMNRLDRATASGALSSGAAAAANAAPQPTTLESVVRDRMRIGLPGPSNRWGIPLPPSVAAPGESTAEVQRLREKRRKRIAARDVAVQLLSRTELAALTRFIFLPNHALSGPLVSKIMLFVCENGRARSQFIQLMLSILDSNATTLEDVDAVIRLAITASSSAAAAAASAEPSLSADQGQMQSQLLSLGGAEHAFALSDLHTSVPAYVPAQRSLEVLHALAAHNVRASMHFLVEHHHHHHTLKPPLLLQGKARADGDDEIGRFPVVHLLRLLEKPLYYSQGNTVTELLMQLLSTITKPLGGMVRRNLQHLQGLEPTITELPPVDAAEGSSVAAPPAAASASAAAVPVQLPGIPGHALRAIVNVLAAGECTSRTFQHTLSLIQNLSHMTGVLSVITDELVRRASELSDSVCEEIGGLLGVLKDVVPASQVENPPAGGGVEEVVELSAENIDRVRDITLGKFSPASSHQSRLLRLLMAIDYISTTVTKRLEDRRKAVVAEKKPAVEVAKPEEDVNMDVDSGLSAAAAAASTAAVDEDLAQELMRLRSLSLSNDTHFVPLWEATSQCLRCASAVPELAHVATVLLPLIESFMVVYKPVLAEKSRMTDSGSSSTQVSPMSVSPSAGEAYFQNFTERHKKILNTLVRNNPGLLSGSFSLLVFNPHVLDFDNKRSYFYQRLHDDSANAGGNNRRAQLLGQGGGGGGAGGLGQPAMAAAAGQQLPSATHAQRPLGQTLHLNVRRETVFEDSYHQFAGQSGEEIKRGRIHVKFRDEEGVDAGGVSREWFQALARQMFNPDYALFKPSAAGRVTYQPNPQSWVNPDHLQYFKFVGRIIGKAIVDQRVLDAYFTRSFYKHILGRKVDYRDMEAIDPSYYKSLEWILENDITDLLEETFSIEVDDFGQHRVVDLIPNGHEVNVTEENKAEYVRLVTLQRLYLAIKDQIKSFLTGFHDLIPKDLIQIFNEQELELLISGMPDIDVDDWRNNTEYHGGFNSGSAQIQWFWRAVRSFDQEERAKLLQFVTGTSKVPLEGFAHLQGNQGVQKFQIHKDFGSPSRLPTAHTCFNQLDLPLCESFDTLRANLLLAISECSTGFGFM